MSSCSVSGCLEEEADPYLALPSFQVVVQSNKVSPETLPLQAKHSQLSQLLLIGLTL